MSNFWAILNIIILCGLIIYVIRYKNSQKDGKEFRIYQDEDDEGVQHYRRGNFITTHPNDTDRMGEAYDDHQWRFTMPHAAVDMLIECFSEDEKKAYKIKRAIEISIEHYAIEMADNNECARMLEDRAKK